MRYPLSPLFILAISVTVAHAQPPTTGFCIENKDSLAALFVVDAGAHFRDSATLAPGERLCTPEFETPVNGFVSVFYDETAVEGCSRLASAGAVQTLLKYHNFDNCEWQATP